MLSRSIAGKLIMQNLANQQYSDNLRGACSQSLKEYNSVVFIVNHFKKMISKEKLEQLSLEAAKEIGEDGADLVEMVTDLKKYLEENHKNLTLPPNPDEFLLRFLRDSKFDIFPAAKKVSQYFTTSHQLKDFHHLCNSSSIEWLFREGVITVSKERDSKGRIILLYRQEFIPPTPNWDEVASVGCFLVIDYLHRISVDTQRIGFVFLADVCSFSWTHLRYTSPRLVMIVGKFLALGLPGRVKGYHLVRNPTIFNFVVSMVKPFLSKKIKSRLHSHAWDFRKLHELIEPQSLPKYLGGEVADDEYGDAGIFDKIVAEDEYHKNILKYGYNN